MKRSKKKQLDEPIVAAPGGLPLEGPRVAARCPVCGHQAVFEAFDGIKDLLYRSVVHGQRRCPNPDCKAHLFFVAKGTEGVTTFPAQRIDFETDGVPGQIRTFLTEAIECYANHCYTAAAMMIRRALEAICDDRSAPGATLQKRIHELGREIMLPMKLLDDINLLRVFGDDKADVKLSTFPQVGKDEADAGIAFTKGILRAAYQYGRLIDKLQALKEK